MRLIRDSNPILLSRPPLSARTNAPAAGNGAHLQQEPQVGILSPLIKLDPPLVDYAQTHGYTRQELGEGEFLWLR